MKFVWFCMLHFMCHAYSWHFSQANFPQSMHVHRAIVLSWSVIHSFILSVYNQLRYSRIDQIASNSVSPMSSIGIGRCSDLGGDIFFKQQKCDLLLLLADTNENNV